jgi:hypothetical protein
MPKDNKILYSAKWLSTLLLIFLINFAISAKDQQQIISPIDKVQQQISYPTTDKLQMLSPKAYTVSSANNKSGLNDYYNCRFDSIRFEKDMKVYDYSILHMKRSFTWQFYSGIVIFVMVIIIVSIGLLLSYKQFQLTELQIKSRLKKADEQKTEVDNNINIEISKTGLKINTAVIGLALLFLSLMFFFLYIKYVYNIEVVNV